MRVVLDTCVILDVWLAREPHWRDSAALLGRVEKREIEGVLCPTTVTTLHYLARKVHGERKARELVGDLLAICKVGKVTGRVFQEALRSGMADFEDAVIEAVAAASKADCIATRNIRDFRKSRIPAREPAQLGKKP